MAWTAPTTRATGDLITAAIWNADVEENMRQVWRESSHVEFTSSGTVTASTDETALTIVTSGTVINDGTSPIAVEFFAPEVRLDTTVLRTLTLLLWGGTTHLGVIGKLSVDPKSGTVQQSIPFFAAHRFVPDAGTTDYTVKARLNSAGSGTAYVVGGAGGSAVTMPGYVRVWQKGGA